MLGHSVIWGSFADATTWLELDELLRAKWKHPHGGWLKVDAAVVDAGDGDHADLVMNFCGPRIGRRVFAGYAAAVEGDQVGVDVAVVADFG